MRDKYYGEYVSSTTGQSGCVKRFMSVPQEKITFPPQVSYMCDLCDVTHGFRLKGAHIISTPSQEKAFRRAYATEEHVEFDVDVPKK